MKKLVLAVAVALALWAAPACAQSLTPQCSNPAPAYGVTWTPSQWTLCLSSFQPYLGYTPLNKAGDFMLGELRTMASTTTTAGLNLAPGTAPASPSNGDMWSTSSGIYIQVNGATVGPLGIGSQGAQNSNTVFAGPSSGSAATPSFRALVGADLPLFNSTTAGAAPASGGGTTNFLRADGTWVAPPSTTSANPTATAGPAAVNGSATTFMRSDAAPAVQKATGSQFGIVEPDGVTTYTSSGIISAIPRSYIAGLTLSTAGSSATFSVATGIAADSTDAAMMNLSSAISKTTSSWSSGNNGGCLDTGTIAASTWYAVFEIEDTSGPTVDIVCTKETAGSAPSPTLPSGYSLKRYIGSMKTDGSANWLLFFQVGNRFRWGASTNDFAGGVTTANVWQNLSLNVPLGVQVTAYGTVSAPSGDTVNVRPLGATDGVATNLEGVSSGDGSTITPIGWWEEITDTSGRIQIVANATATMYLWTRGWIDLRGTNQ